MATAPHGPTGTQDQSPSPGQSTPEYLALRNSYRAVVDHIKAQPGDVCNALFEKGYIPPAVRDFVRSRTTLEDEKAEKLVDTVIDKIEYDVSIYHGFMSILKSEGSSADTVVKLLEESFRAEQAALAARVLPSEDPHHSQHHLSPESTCVRAVKDDNHSSRGLSSGVDSSIMAPVKSSNTAAEPTTTDTAFVCPYCKKCSLEQYVSDKGCPEATNKTLFPYLDTQGLSEEDRMVLEDTLIAATKDLKTLFAQTDTIIAQNLNADVTIVKNFALGLVGDLEQKENEAELKIANSVAEVILALHPYKSFLNYEIIESIVTQFGSPDDRAVMQEYVTAFNDFCKRSAFQLPVNVLPKKVNTKNEKILSVKLPQKSVSLLRDVFSARQKMASILGVKKWALWICSIEEGCVCVRFLVPASVMSKILPLSPTKKSALEDAEISIGEELLSVEDVSNSGSILKNDKFKRFKSQLAEALKASAPPHAKQQTEEFIAACRTGEIDKLIDVCLHQLGIEGEAATELRAAALEEAFEGDITFISHLVRESGINLDKGDGVGGTALFWASGYGHKTIVQILLECNASCNIPSRILGRTALWEASFKGHVEVVTLLTNAGAAVDVQEEKGWTALHAACQEGHNEVIGVLMRAKTDLNIQTKNGTTALYAACQKGHTTTVQLLVEAGASLDVQTNDGATALFIASQKGHISIVQILVEAGASLDVQKDDGGTALIIASLKGHVSTVKLLIEAKASLDVQRNDGCTALWAASFNGHVEVVTLLANAGAAVDVQNEDGWTALHAACQEGHSEVIGVLMRAKADLNIQTKDGVTALYIASQRGHVSTVQVLIEAKASLDVQANDGRTALWQASINGHVEVVTLLTNAGAAVDVQEEDRWTALHAACEQGHSEVIGVLMRAKADLNIQTKDGRTALWTASFKGHVEVVTLLTNAGAAVDVQDEDGWTALHAACQEGHNEVIGVLMRAKADLNIQTKAGSTPLDIAIRKHGAESEVVQTLTKAGAKTRQQLTGSDATLSTTEECVEKVEPSTGSDTKAPKPLQQLKSSSVQHESIKLSRMTLTELMNKANLFIISKLRGPKTRSDHANLPQSNRRTVEKNVYLIVDK